MSETKKVYVPPAIVNLKTGDEETIEVAGFVAMKMGTVRDMLESELEKESGYIPLPNVSAQILEKAIEFLGYHTDNPYLEEDEETKKKKSFTEFCKRTDWDKQFTDSLSDNQLFGLMVAANYLDSKPLLDVCAKTVADIIRNLDGTDIRGRFNLKPCFTPEEEAQVREEIEKIE